MKRTIALIIFSMLVVTLVGCTSQKPGSSPSAEMLDKSQIEEAFTELADTWASSLIAGEFEYVTEMPYYRKEHESERESYRQMLERDGTIIVDYEIYGVNRLGESIYQLDGLLLSIYDDYQEIFIPFYFYMDGEWYYALNEYEVPDELLEGVLYKSFEGSLDPDEIEVFSLD